MDVGQGDDPLHLAPARPEPHPPWGPPSGGGPGSPPEGPRHVEHKAMIPAGTTAPPPGVYYGHRRRRHDPNRRPGGARGKRENHPHGGPTLQDRGQGAPGPGGGGHHHHGLHPRGQAPPHHGAHRGGPSPLSGPPRLPPGRPGLRGLRGGDPGALEAADAALVAVSAEAGVQVGTERAWTVAERLGLPGWWWSPSWTRAGTTTPSWRT